MIFGSKFLMSAIYFFLKYLGYATDRHTQVDKGKNTHLVRDFDS